MLLYQSRLLASRVCQLKSSSSQVHLRFGQRHEEALRLATNIGEAAKVELTKLAESQLRKRGVHGNRPDALMYCLSALEKFSKLSDDELKLILYEIAMAGEKGFDINNPEKRYTFQSIDGDFSGLKAVCYMYAAGQRLLPGQNLGIDLSREYARALSLFKGS